MILTIHMKSGKRIALFNPSDIIADYLIGDVAGTGRNLSRTITAGVSCSSIQVTGSTHRNHYISELRLSTREIEFAQVDAPTSEAAR